MKRFAGSNEVAAAAARHTQSPTAAKPHEGRLRGERPRFAGQRDALGAKEAVDERSRQARGGGQRRGERERKIEQFREYHANLRSKGYSDDAAASEAERAQQTGERPGRSRRYEMLNRR